MKRLLNILLLGCLWFVVSCGPKGPRIVQKEGFVLIYDTLDLDLKPLVLPGSRLKFEQAVKEGDGYLCLFTQQNVYNHFSPPIRVNLLLKIDPKTRTFHKVDLPYPQIIVKDKMTVMKDTVYLLEEDFSEQFRFIPENETWEEVSFNEDVVYEDDDWRVVTRDIRYAGSHTWFIDRKTGKEYFFLTKPGQILRYNGYYYLTDPERFRGIADPREGFLCDSTSTYESIIEDCPDCSFNVIHSLARSGAKSIKSAADIYAFGEGDEWRGCESWHRFPDTLFNASFPAKGSLYQMVTTPFSSYVTQVTGNGLNWIIDLEKRYKTWGNGTVKNYKDDMNSFGIIDLGDTLRFLHIRHNVDSLAYTGDTGLSVVLKEILRHKTFTRKEMESFMEKAGFSFVSSFNATGDDGFIYCKVADEDWTGWVEWRFTFASDLLNSIMLVQGLTPYFDGPFHPDRNLAEKKKPKDRKWPIWSLVSSGESRLLWRMENGYGLLTDGLSSCQTTFLMTYTDPTTVSET